MTETQGWFIVVELGIVSLWAALRILNARLRP